MLCWPIISPGPSDYLIVTYFPSSPSLLLGAEVVSFKRKPPEQMANGGLGVGAQIYYCLCICGHVISSFSDSLFPLRKCRPFSELAGFTGFLRRIELPFLFQITYEGFVLILSLWVLAFCFSAQILSYPHLYSPASHLTSFK